MNRMGRCDLVTGFRFFCAALALSIPSGLPAADDGYLKALKAEAADDGPTPGEPLRRVGIDDFEGWLSREYPGSYAFYSRLNANEKDAVFRDYRAGAGIERLRDKIRDLLKD